MQDELMSLLENYDMHGVSRDVRTGALALC